jgi:CelD/BcsL family acetyltransferase involved in cellulose biosynthesis
MPREGGMRADPAAGPFAGLRALFAGAGRRLEWRCPFATPGWIEAWWGAFGRGEPLILAPRRGGTLLGAAALTVSGGTARPIGDPEVCDHFDVAAAPGSGAGLLEALRRDLRPRGVGILDLVRVRPDSIAAEELVPAARRLGWPVDFEPADTAMELDLPASWEAYLETLPAKPRHELKRKLRRLEGAGSFRLRRARTPEESERALSEFLRLFRSGRPDKARFMTPRMARFFAALAAELLREERLDLWALEVNGEAASVAFCFRHGRRVLLYNNAYDERFRPLSAGLLVKALSIRESIAAGFAVYDFLRGRERYKRHLGGRPVPLYRCRIALPEEGPPKKEAEA